MNLSNVIAIISVIVAIIGLFFVANDTKTSEQTIENIKAGRDVTIIQTNTNGKDTLGTALNSQNEDFIGALDREYKHQKGYIHANANFNKEEISFIQGNCSFSTKIKQNGISWDLYLIGKDGICKFLKEVKVGKKIMRIIPTPGAMANSGRVLEFTLQSGEYVLDDFFGVYTIQ